MSKRSYRMEAFEDCVAILSDDRLSDKDAAAVVDALVGWKVQCKGYLEPKATPKLKALKSAGGDGE